MGHESDGDWIIVGILYCVFSNQVIESNKKLLKDIAEDKRDKKDVESKYTPLEKELVGLLDEVVIIVAISGFGPKVFKHESEIAKSCLVGRRVVVTVCTMSTRSPTLSTSRRKTVSRV